MNKRKIMLAMLLIASLSYGLAYLAALATYQNYVEKSYAFIKSKGIPVYAADVHPFASWFKPLPFFIGAGFILIFLWAVCLGSKKLIAITGLLLLTMMPCADACFHERSSCGGHVIIKNNPSTIIVNVLCAGDEEFFSDPNARADVEREIEHANSYVYSGAQVTIDACFEDLGIRFEVKKWVHFYSRERNYYYSTYYMLDEAIRETGFWSGMRIDGHVIDFLFVITGQDIDLIGLSPPTWDACILKSTYARKYMWGGGLWMKHEFSHQFWADHCGNRCVMNIDFFMPKRGGWCDHCRDCILDNKYKWVD